MKYNIEFSHIYINETFSREHFDSLWRAKRIKNQLESKGFNVTTSVLIDDYNPVEKLLDIDHFLKKLDDEGITPDFVVFEASLVKSAYLLLNELNSNRAIKSVYRYIAKNDKVPCSFLILTWYLQRLGLISNLGDIFVRKHMNGLFISDSLINVLPYRYHDVEAQIGKYVTATKYDIILDRIDTRFY